MQNSFKLQTLPLRDLGHTKKISAIQEHLDSEGVFPARLIQGGKMIDLTLENDTAETRERPYLVLEVAYPDPKIQTFIYKVSLEKDAEHGMINEIDFLEKIAPKIAEKISPAFKDKIIFPAFYKGERKDEHSYLMEQTIHGKIGGGIHKIDRAIFSKDDIDTMVEFIIKLQSISVDVIKHLSPQIILKNTDKEYLYKKYKADLVNREKILSSVFGIEQYQEMFTILEQNKDLLSSGESVFNAGDINPSNIIKTQDNKLCFIDWERTRISNAQAVDYVFMFADMWNAPELQDYFFDRAIERNKNSINFKEFFRLDFIFNRGT